MRVSLQLSRFYLSHTWLFGTSCHFGNGLPDAMGDRGHSDPRGGQGSGQVGCGHVLAAVLGQQEPSLVENGLPVRLDKPVFEQGVKQDRDVADVVYPDAETFPAGEQCLHVLDAEGRNAKQMIGGGASHDAFHLFSGKIAAKRKRRGVHGAFRAGTAGREFAEVVFPLQPHAVL